MILTLITIFTLIGLLSYYIIFSRIKISSFDSENNTFNEAVTVIICAKNELENLKSFFPYWIHQEYSDFELIIVNDQSSDGSFEYLKSLEKDYHNLKVINIPIDEEKVLKGKRHALFKGIQASKNDYLLFTDADCKPLSKHWISEMTKAFYHPETEIVLGYSPYKKEKGFLNKLIQYETILTAMQYFGFAEAGMPYMSVGRNVAYKKSLLTEKVFKLSNKSIGGDDDLVFQQIASKENTAYQISTDSITESIPPETFKEWFLQKKRHLGSGVHYQLKFKILLGFYVLINIALYIIILFLLFNSYINLLITILACKYLYINYLYKKNILFNVKYTLSFYIFIVLDIIYWFFYLIFALGLKF